MKKYKCRICQEEKAESEFYAAYIINYNYICKNCEKIKRHEKRFRSCPICNDKFCVFGPAKECSLKCKIKNNILIDQNECWNWKGRFHTSGYPKIIRIGLAHRISYLEYIGNIEENDVISQICNNHKCVNPAHLKKTCIEDFNRKKMTGMQIGEDNYFSKLSENDVNEIKNMRKEGYTYKEISENFLVHESHIGSICREVCWKHLKNNLK